MQNAWKRLFPIVLYMLLLAACKNKQGGTDNNNDPVFKLPAIKNITEQINAEPKNAALYFERGNLLHKVEKDSLALSDYKKAGSLDSTKAEYFSAIGDLMFEHKDISGSVPWIQKAIKLNPDDIKAHLKMAKMFLFIKDYEKGFSEVNIVLRHDVYNPEAYFLKGMMYKEMKDSSKAISSFLTSVQVDPDYRASIIQLGQLYAMQKNPIALKYYDNAFKLDTTDVFPLYAKGVFYKDNNDYEKAKAAYKDAIIRDPQYADAYFNMGWVLIQQDSLEKAKHQYDYVTKIEPNNAVAYYNRGLCSEMMHNKQDAINDYKQALVFNSKYQDAMDGIKRLGGK